MWNRKNSYFSPFMLKPILTEHINGEREFEPKYMLEDYYIERLRAHPYMYDIEGDAVHSYKDKHSAIRAMMAVFVPSPGRWYEIWECEIDLDKVKYCFEGGSYYGASYASSSLKFKEKVMEYNSDMVDFDKIKTM
jgi:hypothetical protein